MKMRKLILVLAVAAVASGCIRKYDVMLYN